MHRLALDEVSAERHPERIPGGGPEQDYLSRLFAPHWTHIALSYNFQLHHVFYSLESLLQSVTDASPLSKLSAYHTQVEDSRETATDNIQSATVSRAGGIADVHLGSTGVTSSKNDHWIPRRLSIELSDISIVHFSGEMKLWDRDYLTAERGPEYDALFAERLLCTNQPWNTKLWFQRGGSPVEYERFGVRLTATGWEPVQPGVSSAAEVSQLIGGACDQVRQAALLAVAQWRSDFEALHEVCPGLPPLHLMLNQLQNPWGNTCVSASGWWTDMGWSHSWHADAWVDYNHRRGWPVHSDTAHDS